MIRRLIARLFRHHEPEPHSIGGALAESGYEPDPRYRTGRELRARKRGKSGFRRYVDRERQVIPINRRSA